MKISTCATIFGILLEILENSIKNHKILEKNISKIYIESKRHFLIVIPTVISKNLNEVLITSYYITKSLKIKMNTLFSIMRNLFNRSV